MKLSTMFAAALGAALMIGCGAKTPPPAPTAPAGGGAAKSGEPKSTKGKVGTISATGVIEATLKNKNPTDRAQALHEMAQKQPTAAQVEVAKKFVSDPDANVAAAAKEVVDAGGR